MARICLILFGGFLALLSLEASYHIGATALGLRDHRVLLRELRDPHYHSDSIFLSAPLLEYRLKPNSEGLGVAHDYSVSYQINSRGMRDLERDWNQLASPILALGDSFTFGVGIEQEERFTAIAEKKLGRPILNAAVPGWGIEHELIYFAEFGLQLKPKTLLLFLNQGDLERPLKIGLVRGKESILTSIPKEAKPNFAKEAYTIFLSRQSMPSLREQLVLKSRLLSHLVYSWKFPANNHDVQDGQWVDSNQRTQATEERTKILLREFLRLALMHKIEFIVVNIDPNFGLGYIGKIDPRIRYIDLSKILSELAKKQALRFPHDGHFNKNTNQFLAEELAAILQK
jgi:hypothetical protein